MWGLGLVQVVGVILQLYNDYEGSYSSEISGGVLVKLVYARRSHGLKCWI